MKATELRIGNYVLGKRYPEDEGEVIIVNSVDDSGINLEVGYGGEGITREFYHDDIFPIPLTPEILEKSGFEKTGKFLELNNIILLSVGDVYYYYYNSIKEVRAMLKHLHQLQNLYFALTGEELTINL